MADPLYRWNGEAERYIAPSGRFVSRAAVRATLDIVLDVQMARVSALSDGLVAGNVDLATWRAEVAQASKIAHLEGVAVARGGWAQLDDQTFQFVGQRVRSELGYLQAFHDDIASGVVPLNGAIAARAEMYVEAGRGTQRQVERQMAVNRGAELERNIGGDGATSCSGCAGASAQGWVAIGSLVPPGSRQCGGRCRCHLNFRQAS